MKEESAGSRNWRPITEGRWEQVPGWCETKSQCCSRPGSHWLGARRNHWKIMNKQKSPSRGFPAGAVVENLPANAGDMGSSPGLGRSHMPWSNWAREPQLLSLRVWSLCPATGGAAIVRGLRTAMKSGPCLPQLEKALARNKDPTQLKNNNNK